MHSIIHNFKFDDTKILCTEPSQKPRQFLEMLHIYYHDDNNINRQQDTQFLKHTYKSTIDLFKSNAQNHIIPRPII